jgi:hypothetical protein
MQSSTLLHGLGQTEIGHETKFLAIADRICLNNTPSKLLSNKFVVSALPKFEASVSNMTLVIPGCSALSNPCRAAKASA